MGKPLPSPIRFQHLARIVASNRLGPTAEDVLRNQKKWMELKSQNSDFRNRKIEGPPVKPLRQTVEDVSRFQKKKMMDVKSESSKVKHVTRIKHPKELPVKPLRQTVEDVFRFQKKMMDVKSEPSNSAKPIHVTRIKPPKEPLVKPLRPTADDLLNLRNKNKKKMMMEVKSKSCKSEKEKSQSQNDRTPLAEVVSDCVNRWFEDTLKEAEAGDRVMQVLVAQMYLKGYGVTKDVFKGRLWLNEGSGTQHTPSEVLDFAAKQPGYNASDSDSD